MPPEPAKSGRQPRRREDKRLATRRKLVLPLVVSLVATGTVLPFPAKPQTGGGQRDAPAAPKVTLNTVFRVATRPQPLYRVSYTYDFPGRERIYISGVGSMPPKGSLNYLCTDETIQFFDVPGGSLLYRIKVEHPVTLMGTPAPSIPDETQFPRESRHGHWNGQGPFAERAFAVLDRYFHSGYRAYERDNAISYLSTYTEVSQSDDGTHTEVSILISYPAKRDTSDIGFTVAFTARERRSHTDWRSMVSDSSKKIAEAFVDGILNALEREQGEK